MVLYKDKIGSKCDSLSVCGAAIYTICKEQDCHSVINSFLQEVLTYDMCNYIRKAVKNVVSKANTHTTMYLFSPSNFDTFCIMASEDNSNVKDGEDTIMSLSVLSNLLYTTDTAFLQSDIPELSIERRVTYKPDHVYIIRSLHRVIIDSDKKLVEDIVVYVPKRYML